MNAIRAKGANAHGLKADLSVAGAMDEAIAHVVRSAGRINILVNNAAVMFMHRPGETPRSRWERMAAINLLAVIEGCDAAIRRMRALKVEGRIVNISSLASRLPGGGVYGATKAAVEKYSDELRNELEADPIRITTIVPGGFSTNLGRDLAPEERAAFQQAMGDKLAACEPDADGRTPYFGVPDDIARAVLFAVAQPSYLNISEMVVRPARNIDPSAFQQAEESRAG